MEKKQNKMDSFHLAWRANRTAKLFIPTIIFWLIVLFPYTAKSQSLYLSIAVKDAPLSEVFRQIEQQAHLSVVYNVNDINPSRKVSFSVKNENIIKTLDLLFKNTGITYTIISKHIVLSILHKNIKKSNLPLITVRGKVTDEEGKPLLGVNVLIKGTYSGVITDEFGDYTLNVPADSKELVFSYIGYKSYTAFINNNANINVVLTEDTQMLNEIVVTAMGIEKKSKSLTYTVQSLLGSELTRAKDVNFINALQGKSANLIITPNASGAGGASKILLRGNKSIKGSNNPLIVIDGVPVANNSYGSQDNVVYGDGYDLGDALSTINPDDIAGITILKGAASSSLYGSAAANGVIMITTKQGSSGSIHVNVSSNMTIESPYNLPKLQNTYGAKLLPTGEPMNQSWGSKLLTNSQNRLSDFYQTGYTLNNTLSLSGGSDNSRTYFSYGNVKANGIMPTNSFLRHTLSVRQNFHLPDKKLDLSLNGNYVNQNVKNKHFGGMRGNPLTGLYLFPRNGSFSKYKGMYEKYNTDKDLYEQNWILKEEHNQNPYWLLNKNKALETRNRFCISAVVKYTFPGWFNIQGRLSYENDIINYRKEHYASSWKEEMGSYKETDNKHQQLFGDIMVELKKDIGNFNILAIAGGSFSNVKEKEFGINAEGGDFPFEWIDITDKETGKVYQVPNGGNAYFVNNFNKNNYYRPQIIEIPSQIRLNSVFGMLQLGYKEKIYLDVTARNDWSSTLAFTNNKSMAYFYPSLGINILLNEIFNLDKEKVNLFKLRGSYSIVGNGLSAYVSSQRPTIDGTSIVYPTSAPFEDLKPEKTYAIEGGFDLLLFNNSLHFDFTFYKTNTKNQFFTVEAPWGSGYKYRNVNAGNVQNMGCEVYTTYYQPLGRNGNWKTELNFSYNKNLIKELYKGIDKLTLQDGGGILVMLKEGGSYGDIYARTILRDKDGIILLDENGAPMKDNLPAHHLGNLNANIHLGWANTFTYKDFVLYFLIDGKIGGKVMSATEAMLDGYGVSKRSGDARLAGGVPRGDGTMINAEKYYHAVGATAYNSGYAGGEYVYSSSNLRLREFSLGYTFRNALGISRHISTSIIARNLFFLFKKSPCDPDISGSISNGWQGIDVFSLPSTRSIGLNLKFTF